MTEKKMLAHLKVLAAEAKKGGGRAEFPLKDSNGFSTKDGGTAIKVLRANSSVFKDVDIGVMTAFFTV